MNLRRLGWAGVELTSGSSRLVIDHIEHFGAFHAFIAEPHAPLPPPSGPVDAALVTHLHDDHTDAAALARALVPGGPVLRPAAKGGPEAQSDMLAGAEQGLAEHGLATDVLEPWDTRTIGPFAITAVPAVDGVGEPQLSWVVEADGTRVFHGGDTMWHGSFWDIAARCGAPDVAFLPINGALCRFPTRRPASAFPSVLDAEQAAAAARVLGARRVVPIHPDGIDVPPYYVPVEDPVGAFTRATAEDDAEVVVLETGAWLSGVLERDAEQLRH